MIDIQCSGCGKRYRVPEAFGGKKTRCKQCSAIIAIPEAPAAASVEDPILVEEGPEPPPPPAPLKPEPAPSEAPAKPARKPMKLPARGGAGGGAKKPLSRPALHARKPFGKSAEAKPSPSRKTRLAAADDPGDTHEVVGEKGGERRKALLVGGILMIVLLGCAAGWYFLAGPGAESATPSSKAPKAKPAAGKETTETTRSEDAKLAGSDEGTTKAARVPGAPLDPLSSIPKDVHFVAQIGVGQVANIPGVREGFQKHLESSGLKEFFADADLDPTGQIGRAWIAGEIPASALEGGPGKAGPAKEDTGVLILEGTFDRSKLVDALEKHSLVAKDPKKTGDLAVYELAQKDGTTPRLVLPSDDQIILGVGETFDGTLRLLEGKGSSVRENEALKAYSKDFEPTAMAWVAFHVPEAIRGRLAAKVEGGFLSIDRSPAGDIALALKADCASPEDAAGAKEKIVKPLLSVPQQFLPPQINDALKGLEVEAEGKTLSIKLEIPAKVLEAPAETEPAAGNGDEEMPSEEEAGETEDEVKEGKSDAVEGDAGEEKVDDKGDDAGAGNDAKEAEPADEEPGVDTKEEPAEEPAEEPTKES